MQRRPIFQFDTEASLGLDKVPVGQIISIVAYGVTGPKFYQLMSKSGVTTTTTIAQAVANASLVSASGTASGMPFTPTGTLASTTVQTAIAELDTEKLAVGANAVSATKLATARSIALSGDVTGSATFDGSANISISATVADDSHNHAKYADLNSNPVFSATNLFIRPAGGGDAGIEIGSVNGVASNSFVDFHSGAVATDFDSRISATGGNGTVGKGDLTYMANSHNFNSPIRINTVPVPTASLSGTTLTLNF